MNLLFNAWDHRFKQWAITEFTVFGEVTAFNLLEHYFSENPVSNKGVSDPNYVPTLGRLGDIELVQYTGRDTFNGDKVFDKDILYHPDNGYGVVKWVDEDCFFCIDFGSYIMMMNLLDKHECEKVSSSLENPEKLELI